MKIELDECELSQLMFALGSAIGAIEVFRIVQQIDKTGSAAVLNKLNAVIEFLEDKFRVPDSDKS